jgi:long-chain fatty acid transport protein
MLPYASLFHHLYMRSHPETHRMRRSLRYALSFLAGFPALLGAQGFGIYELGSCGMGRAGTGVAAPCSDGSAIFFNPAGLAGLKGWHISGGVTLIKAQGNFTSDVTGAKTDLDNPWIPVPSLYLAYGATPKLGVGVGVFAPYGLETRWPLSFDGRFTGYDNIIRTLYIQPTAAYQVNPWLSLGAGLDIVYGRVELNQRLDLADQVLTLPGPTVIPFTAFGVTPGTDFADAHLEASKTKLAGAHFGATVKVNDRLSIGARYLMHAKMDYSGTATFDSVPTGIIIPTTIVLPGGLPPIPAGTPLDAVLSQFGVYTTLLPDQAVTTTITNPEQFVLGVSYKLGNAVTVLADYQLTRWGKRFQTLPINFSQASPPSRLLYTQYNDASDFRLGAEWAKSAKLTLRGGYLYNTAAAPAQTVTPLLPEGARNEVTVGAGIALAPKFTLDLAYQFIKQNDRRGRTRDVSGIPPTTALNNGLYAFSAHLIGLSLAYTF